MTGQDEKQLTAVVVLSPQELASEGFLEKEEGDRLQNMADNINDPHCSKTDYAEASQELNKACEKIRSNKELVSYLNDDAKRLLKNFRKWEQVGHFTIVLEPVSVAFLLRFRFSVYAITL